jgi:hypothetical protein
LHCGERGARTRGVLDEVIRRQHQPLAA